MSHLLQQNSQTSDYLDTALKNYEVSRNQSILAKELQIAYFSHYPRMTVIYGNSSFIGSNAPFLGDYFYYFELVNSPIYDAMVASRNNQLTEEQFQSLLKTSEFLNDFKSKFMTKDFGSLSISKLKNQLELFYSRYPRMDSTN